MAKRDYYPRAGNRRGVFLAHLIPQLRQSAQTLGLEEADLQQLEVQFQQLRALDQTRRDLRQQTAAATRSYQQQDRRLEQAVRQLVQRCKTHPRYRVALGAELGVEAPPDARTLARQDAVAQQAQPTLRLLGARSGQTLLRFAKAGFDGIELSCAIGSDTQAPWVVIGRFSRSPALDPRANQTQGPETRRYRASYLRADKVVGQPSNILQITVDEAPGRGAAGRGSLTPLDFRAKDCRSTGRQQGEDPRLPPVPLYAAPQAVKVLPQSGVPLWVPFSDGST